MFWVNTTRIRGEQSSRVGNGENWKHLGNIFLSMCMSVCWEKGVLPPPPPPRGRNNYLFSPLIVPPSTRLTKTKEMEFQKRRGNKNQIKSGLASHQVTIIQTSTSNMVPGKSATITRVENWSKYMRSCLYCCYLPFTDDTDTAPCNSKQLSSINIYRLGPFTSPYRYISTRSYCCICDTCREYGARRPPQPVHVNYNSRALGAQNTTSTYRHNVNALLHRSLVWLSWCIMSTCQWKTGGTGCEGQILNQSIVLWHQ